MGQNFSPISLDLRYNLIYIYLVIFLQSFFCCQELHAVSV